MKLSLSKVLKLISYWPPYLISGIRVVDFNSELTRVTVRLKSRFWNRNYFGTHYGGSLFSMCDPFYVFLLHHHLGSSYIVWDKAARIEFVKATSKPVYVTFELTQDEIKSIEQQAQLNRKVEPEFSNEITDADGECVAKIHKTLYVRYKD